MFRAQELLKLIDIINREIIKFEFVFLITICPHIQFISHKRTFQHSKMLNAPFRYVLLCDVILKNVKEGNFRSYDCFVFRRIEK